MSASLKLKYGLLLGFFNFDPSPLTTAGFAFFNMKGNKKQAQKKKKGMRTPMDKRIEGIMCFEVPSMFNFTTSNQIKMDRTIIKNPMTPEAPIEKICNFSIIVVFLDL
jgi:hypothetical protein